MRSLIVSAMLFLAPIACATTTHDVLSAEQQQKIVAAYHALKPADIEAKKIPAVPESPMTRIDVSQRIRSASFGHTTTLLVPSSAKEFYVEYGKSTNTPAAFFGPFPVTAK